MNFINPFILLGLVASSIPIIIHLLNLRKKKKVEFSSLQFLKQLQDNKIRKLKIKQWLLLLLRTLIIVFAVLALARPTISNSIPGFESYSKSNSFILIDNSLSMEISDEYGNRFRRAKNLSNKIIDLMQFGDKVAVGSIDKNSNFILTKDFKESTEEISSINYNYFESNLNSSLEAFQINTENEINNNLLIISDGQTQLFEDLSVFDKSTVSSVKLIKLNGKSLISNISIDSVLVKNSIFQLNKNIELEIYLNNFSDLPQSDQTISLYINSKKITQKSFPIKGNSANTLKMSFQIPERGFIDAYLEIESDDMIMDNRYYFGFVVPEKPNILLLSDLDETFLEIAISLNNEIIKKTTKDLSTIDLKEFDLIFVNDGAFSNSGYNRFESYIKNGGNLILFDNVNSINQKDFLNKIGYLDQVRDSINTNEFINLEKLHPIFDGVFNTTKKSTIIESPKIKNGLFVKGDYDIINTEKGSYLSEKSYGEGKMIFVGSSTDLNSSNLPLTGIFPSLVNRMVYYLTAGTSIKSSKIIDKQILNVSNKMIADNNFTVIAPNQSNKFVQSVPMPSGNTIILNDLNQIGNYKIVNSKNQPVGIISLNHLARESKLEILDNKEIEQILENSFPTAGNISVVDEPEKITNDLIKAQIGTEIWQLFIILALICAALEMIIQRVQAKETSV